MTPPPAAPPSAPETESETETETEVRTPVRSAQSPPPISPPATQPASKRLRWIGSAVAIGVVVGVGWLAWHLTHPAGGFATSGRGASAPASGAAPGATGGGGPGGGRSASTVGLAVAATASIPVYLDALGTVTPVANVTVRPQVSGVLTQVLFREGQTVRRGDLLATIDPQAFETALAQARGARQRDDAQLEAARVTLQRFRTLLGQDSIARQEVDTQAALVKQLEGTVAIDRANEAAARLNVSYARIVAPVAGRVGLRPVDAGNYVAAGAASGIAVITQVAPIDVEFAVPQDRVPEIQARVAAGAQLPVEAFDRSRTRLLDTGTFSTLDNLVDTTTGTVRAKARFANAGGALYPNQFVNARLLLRTVADAVVVPVTALRNGPAGDFVYVLQPDRTVQLRPVKRGEATADRVVIAEGLAAGEQVVTEGGDRLRDGARVQTAADRPARAASAAGPASTASAGSGGRDR